MDDFTEEKIKRSLKTKVLKASGIKSSGCINEGEGFYTDRGLVFIKKNNSEHAQLLFKSELASLRAIEKTKTVRVPHPIDVIEGSHNTFYFIMEFIEMHRGPSKFSKQLGENLAKLHLHNEMVAKNNIEYNYVNKFGFDQKTCVGLYHVNNTWSDSWPKFYVSRLEEQIKRTDSTEALELWIDLQPLVPRFFENIKIVPSLLHGDLWKGNIGETNTEPVIYDPGSVYGHHEFDLAITSMFGTLDPAFYDSYHKYIPKAEGFKNREKLYRLFHYLNHWNHFGDGYKYETLNTINNLIKTKFPIIN